MKFGRLPALWLWYPDLSLLSAGTSQQLGLCWPRASQKFFPNSLSPSPTRLIPLTLSRWLQWQHLLSAVLQSNVPCSQGPVTSISPRTGPVPLPPLLLVTIYKKHIKKKKAPEPWWLGLGGTSWAACCCITFIRAVFDPSLN